MATNDPTILGRIDITLQFLHQFGDEDAYVAVECKRVQAGDHALNGSYVTTGVDRFATGQYAAGHDWGFMLGHVLALPASAVVDAVDARIRKTYGESAGLTAEAAHTLALAVSEGALAQNGSHVIRIYGDGRALAVAHAAFEAGRQDVTQHDQRVFIGASVAR